MLIVANKWLVLGPNRHGTTYTEGVLRDAFGDQVDSSPFSRKHNPLCKIPAEVREGKIVVGIIRSPLRWYVSKWRRFWDEARPEKRYSFAEYFERHAANPHGPCGKNMEDLPLSPAGIGVWSYKHLAYHCPEARKFLGAIKTRGQLTNEYPSLIGVAPGNMLCTETLARDLVRVFGKRVEPYLNQDRHASSKPVPADKEKGRNAASEEDAHMQFWTPELLDKVRERDGWLVRLWPQLDCYATLFGRTR